MNRLNLAKRVLVASALVEENTINSIVSMTGVAKHTILKLLEDMGCACAAYHHRHVRGLHSRRLQCDEIWAFSFNFVRVHRTLRVTPAMEAGIADHVWSFEVLIALLDANAVSKAA